MRLLSSLDLSVYADKNVLVRVSLNVPIEAHDARQKYRIAACADTVDALVGAGARVALLAHFGRPEGKVVADMSLAQLTDDVARILGCPIVFASDCVGPVVTDTLAGLGEGAVALLENVRFHGEEESDDAAVRRDFAARVAAPFDLYVNDDFSVCHRDQATVTEIAHLVTSCAGYQVAREVGTLTNLRHRPEHPAIAVLGGAKIKTKLPLIRALEDDYDTIYVGGKIANEAIDEKIVFGDHVVLPTDFVGDRYDIGPATTGVFVDAVRDARTILWNGPVGWYEKEEYAAGTKAIVDALATTDAFVVAGGGESIEALERYGVLDRIDFVSTGGGALLEFMSGEELPGLAVLGWQREGEEGGRV